jgi:hypothetical protein
MPNVTNVPVQAPLRRREVVAQSDEGPVKGDGAARQGSPIGQKQGRAEAQRIEGKEQTEQEQIRPDAVLAF